MSYSQPHRYILYYTADYWGETQKQEIGYVYMSSIPSKDEILKTLKNNNQLDGLDKSYVDNLTVDRPLGWYYKEIRVCAHNDTNQCVWKFEPAP